MSLLPVLLSVTSSYAKAALNNTTAHEYVSSSESSCTSRRTLYRIVTSCVITLFACAWTAVHPNIPGLAESTVFVVARRLYIMILAIGVPEIIVMWAVRQLLAARTTRKQFQEALQDGTLELRVEPYCKPRLVSRNVPCGADEATITIPKETAKSVLASLWSSIRAAFCRTPHQRKLGPSPIAVESLESHYYWTLKHSFYAWMGGFMLFIDSDKDSTTLPHEVYHPLTPDELLQYLKEDRVQMSMVSEKELDDRSKGEWLSKTIAVMQLVWFVVQLVARYFVQLPTTLLEIATLAVSILSCFTYAFWWYKPKDAKWSSPVYWKEKDPPKIRYSAPQTMGEFLSRFGFKENWFRDIIYEILHPALNLQGLHSISNAAVSAHRVPYFCGYPPDEDVKTFRRNFPILLIGILAATVFGGVHCLAWNFTFPSYTEKLLWRISSLAITIVPNVMAVVISCAYLSVTDDATVSRTGTIITTYSLGAVGVLYIVCRYVLVVLFLTSLRFLPADVYLEVCWASHIPHLKT